MREYHSWEPQLTLSLTALGPWDILGSTPPPGEHWRPLSFTSTSLSNSSGALCFWCIRTSEKAVVLSAFVSVIMETHSMGRNAYPSEKKVESSYYRQNFSSDSEIVSNRVFHFIGRLWDAEKLVTPLIHPSLQSFIHLFIQHLPHAKLYDSDPAPTSEGCPPLRDRETHKGNILLGWHMQGGPSVGPNSPRVAASTYRAENGMGSVLAEGGAIPHIHVITVLASQLPLSRVAYHMCFISTSLLAYLISIFLFSHKMEPLNDFNKWLEIRGTLTGETEFLNQIELGGTHQ